MVVMMLERVSPSLKGELSRWMIEVQSGVFIGKVSARVRDLLWEKCTKNNKAGRCTQVYRTNNEQGFSIRMDGDSERSIINLDGLELVAVKNAAWEHMFVESENLDNSAKDIEVSNP